MSSQPLGSPSSEPPASDSLSSARGSAATSRAVMARERRAGQPRCGVRGGVRLRSSLPSRSRFPSTNCSQVTRIAQCHPIPSALQDKRGNLRLASQTVDISPRIQAPHAAASAKYGHKKQRKKNRDDSNHRPSAAQPANALWASSSRPGTQIITQRTAPRRQPLPRPPLPDPSALCQFSDT